MKDYFANQRSITREQFKKLKEEFFTKEQNAMIHLGELPELDWLFKKKEKNVVESKTIAGFTNFYSPCDCIEKTDCITVYIRFFYLHEDIYELLSTIAHEFAHVYLFFKKFFEFKKHTEEHKRWEENFLRFLLSNYQWK